MVVFIRKKTRKYKGRTYTSYALVESVRTDNGPRQKTICSLGDLKPRPRDEWLDLVQDNLLACTENLAALDLRHLLLAFVFPSRERMERLNRVFAARGYTLRWINLVADDDSLEARLRQRGVTGEDILGSAREMNAQIRGFEDMPCIDTTDIDIEALVNRVLEMIE